MSLGASLGLYIHNQVLDNSISFDKDGYDMASPNPQVVPKFFAILYPLSHTVWILLSFTFIIVAATFRLICMVEAKLMRLDVNKFNTLSSSIEYCLRTLLIDSVPELDRTTNSANTLRYYLA